MQKWDVVLVYFDWIERPHDKFCVCICPERSWFMLINSEAPAFRLARTLALAVDRAEAHFLTHTSFIDTTKLTLLDSGLVASAWAEPRRQLGRISPTLRGRIVGAVSGHDVMEDEQRDQVLKG